MAKWKVPKGPFFSEEYPDIPECDFSLPSDYVVLCLCQQCGSRYIKDEGMPFRTLKICSPDCADEYIATLIVNIRKGEKG